MAAQNSLDHLILFLPAGPDNLPILPSYFTRNFTTTPGGIHADNLTSNTLILLADGVYIELICFAPNRDPQKIQNHWWGPDIDRKGWTDWCLTNDLAPGKSHEGVKDSHADPIPGARKRADGVAVKWAVTFPKGENGGQANRGKVPFFCHDVTPREYRVPISETSTNHRCGVLGVRQLTVVVKDQKGLDEMQRVYQNLFDKEGTTRGNGVVFEAGRVHQVAGLVGGAEIVLRLPKDKTETGQLKDEGFWYGDVVLAAKADEAKDAGKRARLDSAEDDIGGLWVEYV